MNKENKKNVEEISLEDLVYNTIRLFSVLFKGFIDRLVLLLVVIRRFVIERFRFLLIGIFVGGGLGYMSAKFSAPIYETILTIKSPFLKGYDFIYEIEKLNDYFQEKNYIYLSNVIGIDDEDIKSIKGIKAETYATHYKIYERYGEIKKKDSLMVAEEINSSLFIVKLTLSSKIKDVSKTETWIQKYLTKNENLNTNYKIKKEQLLESEIKLKEELQSLDSLKLGINKKILSEKKQNSSKTVEITLQDEKDVLRNPVGLYSESIKLFDRLQAVQISLKSLQKVDIINSAKSIKENKSSYLTTNILKGTIIGIIVTVLSILLFTLNKYLEKIENTKN